METIDLDPDDSGVSLDGNESLPTCPSCSRTFSGENEIILKKCKHRMCKECIVDFYFKNRNFQMTCDHKNAAVVCGAEIEESEIREVLSEVGLSNLDDTIVSDETI